MKYPKAVPPRKQHLGGGTPRGLCTPGKDFTAELQLNPWRIFKYYSHQLSSVLTTTRLPIANSGSRSCSYHFQFSCKMWRRAEAEINQDQPERDPVAAAVRNRDIKHDTSKAAKIYCSLKTCGEHCLINVMLRKLSYFIEVRNKKDRLQGDCFQSYWKSVFEELTFWTTILFSLILKRFFFFFAYDLDSFPPPPHSLATAHPSTYLNYPNVSQCLKYLPWWRGVAPYVESSKIERR